MRSGPRPGPCPGSRRGPRGLALFEDLLGISDPDGGAAQDRPGCPAPAVDRAGQRHIPGPANFRLYIIEDAHWIDEVSESMIADFITVIPRTPSIVLATYRPEYRGALTQVADAHTVALAPLSDSETMVLVASCSVTIPPLASWP